MTLRVIREPSLNNATLGVLFVNGHFQCFTLEDQIREIPGETVESWKMPGQTAIPQGRYRVLVTPSQRFQRPLPILLDVPGFTGVRIHAGNTITDTEGCILVGQDRQNGRLLQSRVALDALLTTLTTAADDMWIELENSVGAKAA